VSRCRWAKCGLGAFQVGLVVVCVGRCKLRGSGALGGIFGGVVSNACIPDWTD
jgi:hypothetical protein